MASELRVQLLGEVAIRRRDHHNELHGRKLRTTMLALASRAGRAVSYADLAAHLWASRPPASAMKNIQLYVHRIRRQLEAMSADGAGLLARRGGGYSLDVPPDAVDLLHADDLLRRGTESLEAGEWDSSATLLHESLADWPVEEPGDLAATEPVEALVAETAERRLVAVERLARAELELGAGEKVVDELRPLVAKHPLREPFHELFMRALVLCGDRVRAIEVYHAFRARIRTELGLDPGSRTTAVFAEALETPADRSAVMRVTASRSRPLITRSTTRAGSSRPLRRPRGR